MFDIKEFAHSFKGYGRYSSECLVKMFEGDDGIYVCFIDIDKGTSITNASEQLATEIVEKYNLDPEKTRFFETYSQYNYDTFDEVVYAWHHNSTRWIAYNPSWLSDESGFKQIFIDKS